MANHVYPLARRRLMDPNVDANGAFDLNTATIRIALRPATTVYNAAHQFLGDLAGATIGTPQTLANPTFITSGDTVALDGDDMTYTAVADPGFAIAAYVVYQDSGSPATSPLIAYIDTDNSGNPINLRPNGGNITLVHAATGIVRL